MNSAKRWFTLVELIVVITILSILGTVAFISLGSYNKSARNAQRIDHVSKLATVLASSKIQWINLLAFNDTGSEVPNAQIAGTWAIIGQDYKAGNFNEIAFQVNAEQFTDPLFDKKYIVGVTSRKAGSYETATIIEDGENLRAKVIGVYTPRVSTPILWSWNIGSPTFTLGNYADINTLMVWDYVTWSTIPAGTQVSSISSDGTLIRLNQDLTTVTSSLALATTEVAWLILWTSGINPVIDEWSELPYNWGWSSSPWAGASSSSSSSTSGWASTCIFGSGPYGACTFGS